MLAVAFHSELSGDDRLHGLLVGWAREFAAERGAAAA